MEPVLITSIAEAEAHTAGDYVIDVYPANPANITQAQIDLGDQIQAIIEANYLANQRSEKA